MAQKVTGPRGTQDVSPYESYKWLQLEDKLRSIVGQYGFKEIRVPTFEHTELFLRGVGDTTDIVNKEMYTFEDKGKRSITLRPEGTSPTVRSVLEKGTAENFFLFFAVNPFKTSVSPFCSRSVRSSTLRDFPAIFPM